MFAMINMSDYMRQGGRTVNNSGVAISNDETSGLRGGPDASYVLSPGGDQGVTGSGRDPATTRSARTRSGSIPAPVAPALLHHLNILEIAGA